MKQRLFGLSTFGFIVVLSMVANSIQGKEQTAFTWSLSVALKQGYDNNLFLQNRGPLKLTDSLVTTFIPTIGYQWNPFPLLSFKLTYATEMVRYHSDQNESHFTHRLKINMEGDSHATSWKLRHTLIRIDGENEGLIFPPPGDIPAIGGIPVRDRRDAAIHLSNFEIKRSIGNGFIRPVMAFYLHDFQTKHKAIPRYENYVDRYDLGGGVDIGYRLFNTTDIVIGYRYGHQHQAKLLKDPTIPASNVEYSNDYQRILFGIEGHPFEWITIDLSLGPDFRDFGDNVSPEFKNRHPKLYLNAGLTFTPSETDRIQLRTVQYQQPAFGGRSLYEDKTYEVRYRRKVAAKWTMGLGFKAYGGNWASPVNRDDWIYSTTALIAYEFTHRLGAEVSYSYDAAVSHIPDTKGREFTRHRSFFGLHYRFH